MPSLSTSETKKLENQRNHAFAASVDLTNLSAIFALHTVNFLKTFLELFGRFFFFSFAGVASLGVAALAWRQAYLEKNQNGTLVRALVDTIVALAICTAVIGSFVLPAVFGLVSPIIFTAILGAKSLFHAGASLFYLGKASVEKNPEQKSAYYTQAQMNGIACLVSGAASFAVAGIMLIGKTFILPSAIIGTAAGLCGAGYALYRACQTIKTIRAKKQEATLPQETMHDQPKTELSQGAKLASTLNMQPLADQTITVAANDISPVSPGLSERSKKHDNLLELEETAAMQFKR